MNIVWARKSALTGYLVEVFDGDHIVHAGLFERMWDAIDYAKSWT